MEATYKSNRTVFEISQINHRGSAFHLAVDPALEDSLASTAPNATEEERTLMAIKSRMYAYLTALPGGWVAHTVAVSGDTRPSEEVTLENCIDVLTYCLRGRV